MRRTSARCWVAAALSAAILLAACALPPDSPPNATAGAASRGAAAGGGSTSSSSTGSKAVLKVWSSAGVTVQTPQSFRKNALGCGGTPIADTVILGDVRTRFCGHRNRPAVTSVFIGELGAGSDVMSHAQIAHVRIDGHGATRTLGIALQEPGSKEPSAYLAEITFSDEATAVLVRSPDRSLAVRIIDSVRRT